MEQATVTKIFKNVLLSWKHSTEDALLLQYHLATLASCSENALGQKWFQMGVCWTDIFPLVWWMLWAEGLFR